MTAWIKIIEDSDASPDLLTALDESRSPSGEVENVMRIHSLRPNIMRGHIRLYRAILHDDMNRLPPWFQETIGSYVSMLNNCAYSYANHWTNARHLINNDSRADAIEAALLAREPESEFDGAELAALRYAEKLTLQPSEMDSSDVETMRQCGLEDGEILEVNQVCAYFAYVNRLLNGLGVSLGDQTVGYYTDSPGRA